MSGVTLEELMSILRKSVIGQEEYLKKIAVTVWLHHKRIEANEKAFSNLKLQKHNLLCVGPTGSGKTLAVSVLAEYFDFDVMVTDMSAYTGSGWKGKDVEDMIQELYQACGHSKSRTEKAIVIMDEIDKMVLQNDEDRYASFGAENALLKIVEGTELNVGKEKIDTRNILFIAAGAFEGIEWDVKARVNEGKLGFKVNKEDFIVKQDDLMAQITRQDVLRFGMGAQFMGRFADIAVLRKLDVQDFKKILLESNVSVIKDMNLTLTMSCGIKVTIDEAGAEAVAREAIKENTGARGLAQIIMPVINDVMFLVDQDQTVNGIHITVDAEGEPAVKLMEGKREYVSTVYENEVKYNFPKANRRSVEHFCWYVLEPYLNHTAEEYRRTRAMHQLLFSIVFYVLMECNEKEHTMESVRKLVNCCYERNNSKNYGCVYEVLLEEGQEKHPENSKNYTSYYQRYRYLDRRYRMVPVLLNALDHFKHNPPKFLNRDCIIKVS